MTDGAECSENAVDLRKKWMESAEILLIFLWAYLFTFVMIRILHLSGDCSLRRAEGLAELGGMCILPLLWEIRVAHLSLRDAGFSMPRPCVKECAVGLLAFCGILFYNFRILPPVPVNSVTAMLSPFFMLNCLLIATAEETLFRGVLLRRCAALWGNVTGALVVSALFAFVAHLRAPLLDNLLWRFPVSLALCWLYLRKKSLLVPVSLHFLLNLLLLQP